LKSSGWVEPRRCFSEQLLNCLSLRKQTLVSRFLFVPDLALFVLSFIVVYGKRVSLFLCY